MFLDITTFFSGNWHWTLRDAKAAWRVVYGTESESLLWNTLVDRSLVYNVKDYEIIKVHEQLQSLGEGIAVEEREVRERIVGSKLLQRPIGLDGKAIYSLWLHGAQARDQESSIHISGSSFQGLNDLHYLDVNVPIIIGDGGDGRELIPIEEFPNGAKLLTGLDYLKFREVKWDEQKQAAYVIARREIP
ncbi:unnamed protein product [Calypogeia fissa]